CESRIDLTASAGVEDVELQPYRVGSRFHVSQRGRGGRYISWIDEHGHTLCSGHQRMQQFQSLCYQLVNEKIDTRRVAAGPRESGDETKPDRVFANGKDDGDRFSCCLGRQRRSNASSRGDHSDPAANQLAGQRWQPIVLTFRPPVFDRYVFALDMAGLLQALAKCAQAVRVGVERGAVEESD